MNGVASPSRMDLYEGILLALGYMRKPESASLKFGGRQLTALLLSVIRRASVFPEKVLFMQNLFERLRFRVRG